MAAEQVAASGVAQNAAFLTPTGFAAGPGVARPPWHCCGCGASPCHDTWTQIACREAEFHDCGAGIRRDGRRSDYAAHRCDFVVSRACSSSVLPAARIWHDARPSQRRLARAACCDEPRSSGTCRRDGCAVWPNRPYRRRKACPPAVPRLVRVPPARSPPPPNRCRSPTIQARLHDQHPRIAPARRPSRAPRF